MTFNNNSKLYFLQNQKVFILENLVFITIFNIILNALIGLVVFRPLSTIPIWGGKISLLLDCIFTAFFLSFFTYIDLAVTLAYPKDDQDKTNNFWHKLKSNLYAIKHDRKKLLSFCIRATILGFFCVIFFVSLIAMLLHTLGITSFTFTHAVILKSLYAGAMAIILVPFMLWDIQIQKNKHHAKVNIG